MRLRRLGKYRAWIGFSLVADHAMLPGQYVDKGIGVTPPTLAKFVKTDFYTATLMPDGSHRFFQQPAGKHAPKKVLRKEDFARCRLAEMFVEKSKQYSMAEIWEDLQACHAESKGGTVGWPTFLRFQTYLRIKEALDWFSRYTGREWLFYKEGGGTEVLTGNFERLGSPRNWHTPVAGPGHWAMTAFPEEWIYSNFDDKLLTAKIRHWGWMGLRHPGDNNGLVTPDEVKKGLCYFYPVHPVVPVLGDCTHEIFTNAGLAEGYLPYARLLGRMRYAGPWHPAAGVKLEIEAADKEAVRWSLSGGQPWPLLLFVGNADRKVQSSTDQSLKQLNYGTFRSSPQTVTLRLDARPYGLAGPWYAFDAATMAPIASGQSAGEVAVSLEMGQYEMRPVYLCPGTVRDQCVLYASSRFCRAAGGGRSADFHVRRGSGHVLSCGDPRGIAAGGRRVDSAQNAAGRPDLRPPDE